MIFCVMFTFDVSQLSLHKTWNAGIYTNVLIEKIYIEDTVQQGGFKILLIILYKLDEQFIHRNKSVYYIRGEVVFAIFEKVENTRAEMDPKLNLKLIY
jgi:hypothetical protein